MPHTITTTNGWHVITPTTDITLPDSPAKSVNDNFLALGGLINATTSDVTCDTGTIDTLEAITVTTSGIRIGSGQNTHTRIDNNAGVSLRSNGYDLTQQYNDSATFTLTLYYDLYGWQVSTPQWLLTDWNYILQGGYDPDDPTGDYTDLGSGGGAYVNLQWNNTLAELDSFAFDPGITGWVDPYSFGFWQVPWTLNNGYFSGNIAGQASYANTSYSASTAGSATVATTATTARNLTDSGGTHTVNFASGNLTNGTWTLTPAGAFSGSSATASNGAIVLASGVLTGTTGTVTYRVWQIGELKKVSLYFDNYTYDDYQAVRWSEGSSTTYHYGYCVPYNEIPGGAKVQSSIDWLSAFGVGVFQTNPNTGTAWTGFLFGEGF